MLDRAGVELAREVELIAGFARADVVDSPQAALRNPESAGTHIGGAHGLSAIHHLADICRGHGLRVGGVGHVDQPSIRLRLIHRVEASQSPAAEVAKVFVEGHRRLVDLGFIFSIRVIRLIRPRDRQ